MIVFVYGEGEAGEQGAPAGDLYVQVHVRQHHIFERDGNNLYCEVPINLCGCSMGEKIEVPTLDGRVKLKNSSRNTNWQKCSHERAKVLNLYVAMVSVI